jgi:hypothetical protein
LKIARIGAIIVGAVAVLSLTAGTAHAMPAPDYGYGGDDVSAQPVSFGDSERGLDTWGGDRDRDRPTATPLATLEQTCVRRGLCVLRVLFTQRDRTWSCRPVVRPTTRGRDDEDVTSTDWGLDGRSALLDRGDTSWSGDRFGSDDEVARPRTSRVRLLCVLLRNR